TDSRIPDWQNHFDQPLLRIMVTAIAGPPTFSGSLIGLETPAIPLIIRITFTLPAPPDSPPGV
ncbi:hypothetical protein TNCT_708531, partial [Trichonephila clavata]